MIDRQRLREQLARHEGKRRFVYDDASGKPISTGTFVRGKPTIGVGRNLAEKGLSDDEIDYLLDNDIKDAIADAQTFRWFDSLDPVRQAVIVELCFNMGLGKLRTFKKFLQAMAELATRGR
jgi:lysozyme